MTNEDKQGYYNPLPFDFKCHYDLHGENPQTFEIKSREIEYFTPEYAKHVEKHLYNAIVNHRGLNGIELNADPAKKKAIMDEIRVVI